MDRILFGDNQFFGVNHMSEEKARAQAVQFKDTESIIRVLDIAYDMGIRTFMCTTHDRIGDICDHMRRDRARYKDFIYYPCMPYAHKYANAVGQLGIMGTLKKFAPGSVVGTMLRGALAGVTQDIYELMTLLVDFEMKRFEGLNTPVVFLQNVVTDLLLGFDLRDMFKAFNDHVKKKYGAEAGFITMNLPKCLEVCESVGIDNPIICANYNKIGFRMCGGIDEYDRLTAEKKFRCIAMSVYASGAVPPEEAIQWISARKGVDSIVFGASSKGNIAHTKQLIEKYSG